MKSVLRFYSISCCYNSVICALVRNTRLAGPGVAPPENVWSKSCILVRSSTFSYLEILSAFVSKIYVDPSWPLFQPDSVVLKRFPALALKQSCSVCLCVVMFFVCLLVLCLFCY